MRTPSILLAAPLAASLLAGPTARAERLPASVLWLDGGRPELVKSADEAIAASAALRPLDDPEARRLLVEGGPGTRAAVALAEGRRLLGALQLKEADAALGQAEAIAIGELRAADACARLVEIERLRVRLGELLSDETAARRAAYWLAACVPTPTGDDAAAIARHPQPKAPAAAAWPAVTVESEPAGADVFVDLRPAGKTPARLDHLGPDGASVGVELAGYRKVQRQAPRGGTLAVALARDDRLAELIDRVRGAGGDAAEADVADLGRRLGAARLACARIDPASSERVQVRVLDVAAGAWIRPPETFAAAPGPAPTDMPGARLAAAILAPKTPPPESVAARATQKNNAKTAADAAAAAAKANAAAADGKMAGAAPPPADKPAWKKWYTWVAGGALVVGVGAFVIAQHVGDDQITIHATH